MDLEPGRPADSQWIEGGSIPGGEALAAFRLSAPQPSALPVLIAVPHAGRAYPADLIERMRDPRFSTLRLEDRYADRLGEVIARETGAALLVARAPRAMIDLNRGEDDVDWEMFGGAGNQASPAQRPGRRSKSGLGLVPRRLPGLGELWKRHHEIYELTERVETIHRPYHACLAATLAALRDRWGAALLIDLHSMPPLGWQAGRPPAEFVLGDRFGASCHGALVAASFGYFAETRRNAVHNRPYAGGFVLERHADPMRGIHALQLEVDRASYLDSRLAEPGRGLPALAKLLAGLVRRLAEDVAEMGRQEQQGRWAAAAE